MQVRLRVTLDEAEKREPELRLARRLFVLLAAEMVRATVNWDGGSRNGTSGQEVPGNHNP